MAFDIKGLGKLGNQSRRGESAQKYAYRTDDTVAQLAAANYFLPITGMLEVGDLIEVQHVADMGDVGAGIEGTRLYMVTVKFSGFILVTDITGGAQALIARIDDVSTASSATITSAAAGTISKIVGVLGGPITLANSAVACTIGGVAITNGALTVAFAGSTSGSTFTANPTAANVLAVGDVLAAPTDGGSTGTQPLYVVYTVTA